MIDKDKETITTRWLEELIGETLWLWPNDSMRKEAILLAVDEYGFHFKMTVNPKAYGGTFGCMSSYKKGQIVFVSRANKLSWIQLTRDGIYYTNGVIE